MNQTKAQLVMGSWKALENDHERFTHIFYNHMFLQDKRTEALFMRGMKMQGKKFSTMLGEAIESLGDLDRVYSTLSSTGHRHAEYGVTTGHYALMKTAIMNALAEILQDRFDEELRQAWSEAYDFITGAMRSGAARAIPQHFH